MQAEYHGFGVTVQPNVLASNSRAFQDAIMRVLSAPDFTVSQHPLQRYVQHCITTRTDALLQVLHHNLNKALTHVQSLQANAAKVFMRLQNNTLMLSLHNLCRQMQTRTSKKLLRGTVKPMLVHFGAGECKEGFQKAAKQSSPSC